MRERPVMTDRGKPRLRWRWSKLRRNAPPFWMSCAKETSLRERLEALLAAHEQFTLETRPRQIALQVALRLSIERQKFGTL